jgi:hypothetical protein
LSTGTLAGLDGEELDALIAQQMRIFEERGEPFEWKLHGHDRPLDLPDRLRAAGFVPEEEETVVIGRVDAVAAEPSLPDGVVIREIREQDEFARIAQLEESVWNEQVGWVDDLAEEREADPEGLRVFVANAGELTVCAGWVRFPSDTEFATFWGGATLPAWRVAASTARSSPTGRTWPRGAVAATSRWTPPTTAARSWSGSGSSR